MILPMEAAQLIKKKGLKKKFIANECGINNSVFSLWLNGKRRLNDSKLHRVQQVLGI
jgi:transcriptional regulator with XRE-family HTH domain